MNPKQLYGYITSQMTAEQALMRLLQSAIVNYEKLKFPKEEEAIHPIILISLAAMDMGWQMAVENKSNEPEAQVKGLVCGTEEFVNKIYDRFAPSEKREVSLALISLLRVLSSKELCEEEKQLLEAANKTYDKYFDRIEMR